MSPSPPAVTVSVPPSISSQSLPRRPSSAAFTVIVGLPVTARPFFDETPSSWAPVTLSEPVPVRVRVSEENRAAVAASSPVSA